MAHMFVDYACEGCSGSGIGWDMVMNAFLPCRMCSGTGARGAVEVFDDLTVLVGAEVPLRPPAERGEPAVVGGPPDDGEVCCDWCIICGVDLPDGGRYCQVCDGILSTGSSECSLLKECTLKVFGHHDGFGLNESINISCDEPDDDAGSASHHYTAVMPKNKPDDGLDLVARILFQHGPRGVQGSVSGITHDVLYAILIHRLEGLQSGAFRCDENEEQLNLLRRCLELSKARSLGRSLRGVLGTYGK